MTTAQRERIRRRTRNLQRIAFAGLYDGAGRRYNDARFSPRVGLYELRDAITGEWFPNVSLEGFTDCNGRPVSVSNL